MIDFDFQIRKSPARKTLSIRIYPDNRIVVAAPQRLSQKEIIRFIEEKSGWIHKTMKKNLEKAQNRQVRGFVTGEKLLYLGKEYTLKVEPVYAAELCKPGTAAPGEPQAAGSGKPEAVASGRTGDAAPRQLVIAGYRRPESTPARTEEAALRKPGAAAPGKSGVAAPGRHKAAEPGRSESATVALENGNIVCFLPHSDAKSTRQMVRAALLRWYSSRALAKIKERCPVLAKQIGVSPRKITLKSMRSRWGSCSTHGTISLAWNIIMAPEPVLDYLIVHEFCHLIHHNHSAEYWELVESFVPDHREKRGWLRKNGECLTF